MQEFTGFGIRMTIDLKRNSAIAVQDTKELRG